MKNHFTYHVWTAAFGLLLFIGAASPIWDAVCEEEAMPSSQQKYYSECADVSEVVILRMTAPRVHTDCCCIKQTSPDKTTMQSGVLSQYTPSQLVTGTLAVQSDLQNRERYTTFSVLADGTSSPSHVSLFLLNSTFLI